MAVKSAARDFAETILPAAGLGLVSGTNIFSDKAPHDKAVTAPIVGVFNVGGLDPAKNKQRTHYLPSIQIRVVGHESGYGAADVLTENIRNYILETLTRTVVGTVTYYGFEQIGDNAFIGYDENNKPQFSINFRIYRRF